MKSCLYCIWLVIKQFKLYSQLEPFRSAPSASSHLRKSRIWGKRKMRIVYQRGLWSGLGRSIPEFSYMHAKDLDWAIAEERGRANQKLEEDEAEWPRGEEWDSRDALELDPIETWGLKWKLWIVYGQRELASEVIVQVYENCDVGESRKTGYQRWVQCREAWWTLGRGRPESSELLLSNVYSSADKSMNYWGQGWNRSASISEML